MQTTVYIDGKIFTESQVRAWEKKRAIAVLRKLKGNFSKDKDVDVQVLRQKLIDVKMNLSNEQLMKNLKVDLFLSSITAKLFNALSFGKRTFCVTEMYVEGISSVEVVKGLDELMLKDSKENDKENLSACPDHYLLKPRGGNKLEVIETTGGAPLPTQFFIVYGDEVGLSIPRDASYQYQSAGVARLKDGMAIGGIRHQFRDEGQGFRAKLTVEFPAITPGYFIRMHQIHLACEFSFWFKVIMRRFHAMEKRIDGR